MAVGGLVLAFLGAVTVLGFQFVVFVWNHKTGRRADMKLIRRGPGRSLAVKVNPFSRRPCVAVSVY
jgi:hypothetical protein